MGGVEMGIPFSRKTMLSSTVRTAAIFAAAILLAVLLLPHPAGSAAVSSTNRRPVASISGPREVVKGMEVRLDGTGSMDPDGDPLTFQWTLAAKPPGSVAELDDPSSPTPSFVADMEGTYRVRLTVSDGLRASRPSVWRIKALYGRLSNPVSADDYKPVARCGASYLAVNGAGKRLLYLEGKAYERGYATGKLCPRAVYRMTHDFVFNIVGEMLPTVGINIDPQTLENLLRMIWPLLQLIVVANMDAVPGEFLEEMRGISDACREEGFDVTFQDVLTLNLGFDVLESIFVGFAAIFCNEFAVSGNATKGGRTFHGRDFMFPTGGDVFSDEALLIVHKPESGYPLIASAAPGFVGVPTALNSQGVSCGMDMVASVLARPIITGEGTLLLCRKAVQYGGTLEEALALIRDSDRAVPWLYLIAEGKSGRGVVLETTAKSIAPPEEAFKSYLERFFTGLLQTLLPWLFPAGTSPEADVSGSPLNQQAHPGANLEALLGSGDDVPDQGGVMVRDMTYTDPPELAKWVRWAEDNGCSTAGLLFPLQDESYPDLVAMTNHYVLPWKAITYPSLRPQKGDSIWRYRTMLGLLKEGYGKMDSLRAMWTIDFLNPSRCDYYGPDTSQSVKGHHVLMDNTSLEMWSLHGYYDQPWAHADLDDFLR